MKALITGANGFAGTHLVEFLLSGGWEILGLTNDLELNPELRVVPGRFILREIDIGDSNSLLRALKDFAPDHVFHLAAVTAKGVSREAVDELFNVNVRGTQNLLFSAIESGLNSSVVVTGSSACYGSSGADRDSALTEESVLAPATIYGASKLAQEMLASSLGKSTGLPVKVTRAFNHTGPGEGPHMACSSFAKQIAECELGRGSVVRVGNLNSYRDYCDVRDVVRAYVLVAVKACPGEVFNVCSGKAVRMRTILEMLVSMSGKKIEIVEDPGKFKPADVSYHRGDFSKINRELGWKPEIDLEKTLSDLLNYWRNRLK